MCFWQHHRTRRTKVRVQFSTMSLDPAGLYPRSKSEQEINQLSCRLYSGFSGLELGFRCFWIASVSRYLAKASDNTS